MDTRAVQLVQRYMLPLRKRMRTCTLCAMATRGPLDTILMHEGRTKTWLAMQLSARLGRAVYRQEVSDWCRDVHVPEARTRAIIADVLGRDVAELFPSHDGAVCDLPDASDAEHRDAA